MLMPAALWQWLLYLGCALLVAVRLGAVPLDPAAWYPSTFLDLALAALLVWRLVRVAARRERLDAWGDGLSLRVLRWAGLALMAVGLVIEVWHLFAEGGVPDIGAWVAGVGLVLFEASRLMGFEAVEGARRAGEASSMLATTQAPGLGGLVSVPPAPPPPPPRGDSVSQGVRIRVTALPPPLHLLLHKHGLMQPGQASSNCARAVLGLKGQGLSYAAVDLHLEDGSVVPYALLRNENYYHDPGGEASDVRVREVRVRKGFDADALTRTLTKHFGKTRAVEMLRSGQALPPLIQRADGRYGFDG